MNSFSEKTFGSIFRERREELGLTVHQVEKKADIRRAYIESIECMDFKSLPKRVYLERILKRYCEFLDLQYSIVEKLWKEAVARKINTHSLPGDKSRRKDRRSIFNYNFISPIKQDGMLFTPKLLFSVGTIALLLILTIYFGFLYTSISSAPNLDLIEPLDSITVRSDNVNVEGFTSPGNITTINGKEIPVNPDGYFKQTVGLSKGINKIFVQTIGKNGKISTLERTINADIDEYAVKPIEEISANPKELEVRIVAKEITWLRANVDKQKVVEILLNPGNEKVFIAKQTVDLKVGNAGGIDIYINGVLQDPLGVSGEVIETSFSLETPEK
jgi:transcriptional regulator with XRE-family HTH domain